MNETWALNLIRNTFENSFNRERFLIFAKNLFHFLDTDTFIYRGNLIPDAYDSHIKTLERLGKYEDVDGHKIEVLAVQLNKQSSLERARTLQRNFIAWYLNGSRGGITKDAALVAFYTKDSDDWRLSLVKMDYHLGESKAGKIKAITELTPARRFSFLVGANENTHTAQRQLLPILKDTDFKPALSDLESAFSVEVVTKDFFEKYKKLFLDTKEALDAMVAKDDKIKADFQEKNIDTTDFAKKLLGQIVFLYFLQKKGWFGVERGKNWGTGSKTFLRDLFNGKVLPYDNFFNDVLEHLFYDALARDRSDIDHFNPHFNCKIPFLNGGLFDPLNGYDWTDTDILLPNNLFSNKKSENDEGSGILDIFDLYNFTVKEDEPLEREVAVDPEMLGKVFENLLEVKDRKSKGTYYTPREIVHYMCQESLINYLLTELDGKVKRDDIETLIRLGETAIENEALVMDKGFETKDHYFKLSQSIRDNATLLDEKLEKIHVCDPAVGSGAFLVGMMTEVIKVRNILTKYLADNDRSIYDFKRHAIQNCLYGVDIDPGAVEIAKLRLWLSLIVDEEDIKQIKPLPNLDYKIVCGNSLFSVNRQNLFVDYNLQQIEKLKGELFNETNIRKKQEYKEQIDRLIADTTDNNKAFDFEIYFSEIFQGADEYKKGFNIVIANPPYIGEKGHKELFQEVRNYRLGRFYLGRMDYFYFFFHLALDITKKNSQMAFITTNYYITAFGAKKLRRDFRERALIRHLINLNELKIFESAKGQHNMITILSRNGDQKIKAQNAITKRAGVATSDILHNILSWQDSETEYYEVAQEKLYDGGDEHSIRLSGSNISSELNKGTNSILYRIETLPYKLGVLCNVDSGHRSGGNRITKSIFVAYPSNKYKVSDGIFVLSESEVRKLNFSELEKQLVKPLFKNSDIKRYWLNRKPKKFYLNITYPEYSNNDFQNTHPNVYKHLKRYENILKCRRDTSINRYVENGSWWISRVNRTLDCDGVKIVVPYRCKTNSFAYSQNVWYALTDVYFISQKNKEVLLKYILAVLNSKLYYLWLYFRGKRKGETLELYQKPLSEIPVKKVSENEQRPFVELVDKILATTEGDDYLRNSSKQTRVKKYEKQIDQMVYKLYDLTQEEIEIVGGNTK